MKSKSTSTFDDDAYRNYSGVAHIRTSIAARLALLLPFPLPPLRGIVGTLLLITRMAISPFAIDTTARTTHVTLVLRYSMMAARAIVNMLLPSTSVLFVPPCPVFF